MWDFLQKWIIFLTFYNVLKDVDALLDCQIKGNELNQPVVPMCYDNSATSRYVILSTFKAKDSTTNPCNCNMTTTSATTLTFVSHVQPGYTNCGNVISVTSPSSSLYFNCYASGSMPVQAGESIKLTIDKPSYTWDERFCIGISSDITNVPITLTCSGQSLTKPETTTTTTPTTTTTTSTTTSTTTTEKPTTTTQPTTTRTTLKLTTTVSSTTMRVTEPRTSAMSTDTRTQPTSGTTTSDIMTTKQTLRPVSTTRQQQPTTSKPSGGGTPSNQKKKDRSEEIPLNFIIPLATTAFILLIVIIIACCIYSRKKQKKPYELADPELSKPTPYSNLNSGFSHQEEMCEIADNQLYKSADVTVNPNAENTNTVDVQEIKREMNSSTGDRTSGTFVKCEVQPPEDAPQVYAIVDKSRNESQKAEESPRETTENNQEQQVFY